MKTSKLLFRGTIFTAALITAGMLSGCAGKETDPVKLDSSYSFFAEISQNDTTYTAQVSRNGETGWTVTFTQPETLSDVVLTLENKNAVLSYDGLQSTLNRRNLPLASAAGLLTGALDHAALSTDVKYYAGKKGTTKAYGAINGADYQLELNQSDQPVRLTVEGEDFTATIADYKGK